MKQFSLHRQAGQKLFCSIQVDINIQQNDLIQSLINILKLNLIILATLRISQTD